MLHYQKGRDSSKLIVFFAGWGCDEGQFGYLRDESDVLMIYDYDGERLDFDFSRYEAVDVLAYSVGVFMASVLGGGIPNARRFVAVNGNPYLFDAKLGLSAEKVRLMRGITLDNYLDFRRAYICMPDEMERYGKLSFSRPFDSYERELDFLESFYAEKKDALRPRFDKALFADGEGLFDLAAQRAYYGDKLKIVPESKHHVFFRFSSFSDLIAY